MEGSSNFREFISKLDSPVLRSVAEHWNAVRGDRLMPSWSDLSTTSLSPHFSKLWGFQHQPEAGDFTGRLAGKNVMDWLGANFWGGSIKTLYALPVFEEAYRFLKQVVTVPAAGRSNGTLFTMGDKIVAGERIALPLSSDGVHGDAVLGASNYEATPVSGPVVLVHENVKWFTL
jgi:hypothetical protein